MIIIVIVIINIIIIKKDVRMTWDTVQGSV